VAANGCSVRRRKLTPNSFAKPLEDFKSQPQEK
jgi:hypothetical protein